MSQLLESFQLSPSLRLPNRVVMAPMTRCMAGPDGIPTEAMAAYYARRASAGLIVSEAVAISQSALGYPNVPGLFSEPQVDGWRRVVERVHQAGGRIFAQLWHTGRAAHSYFSESQPLAPSALQLTGTVPRMRRLRYEMPRAMADADFGAVLSEFTRAAQRALAAGFDGIELHGANGYLIDQFLHHASNQRADAWGGAPSRMVRFPLAVVDALLGVLGSTPLGVRVSPSAHTNMDADARDRGVFDCYLAGLAARPLAYVHLGLFDDQAVEPALGQQPSAYLRRAYPGVCVGVGGYGPAEAEAAIVAGRFDLAAFGRPFIANPDLVERLRQGLPLEPYEPTLLNRLF